jgi:hypothetical protein
MNLNSTDNKEIRKFGIIALTFFGCLAIIAMLTGKIIAVCVFGSLAILGCCFSLFPQRFSPIYFVWLKIAGIIGKIITYLILAIIYYMVMTPSAQLKRLFGGAPLPVKPDKNVSSYWVTRSELAQPKERFFKRF